MMETMAYDLDREVSTRLTGALEEYAPKLAGKLRPALNLANHQVEWMCPAFMGAGRAGLVAGLAVTVKRGTWVIVLANPRKVLTIQLLQPPMGLSRAALLEHCVEGALEMLGGHPPAREGLVFLINEAVKQHGGPPGKESRSVAEGVCMQIIGALFSHLSGEDRAELMSMVDDWIAADVCPLFVGLVGKGSNQDTSAGVWPLILPFARYIEHLDELTR
jgi:hypothetical protein